MQITTDNFERLLDAGWIEVFDLISTGFGGFDPAYQSLGWQRLERAGETLHLHGAWGVPVTAWGKTFIINEGDFEPNGKLDRRRYRVRREYLSLAERLADLLFGWRSVNRGYWTVRWFDEFALAEARARGGDVLAAMHAATHSEKIFDRNEAMARANALTTKGRYKGVWIVGPRGNVVAG